MHVECRLCFHWKRFIHEKTLCACVVVSVIILSIAKESAYEIIGVSREKEFDRSIIAFLMIDPLQIGEFISSKYL